MGWAPFVGAVDVFNLRFGYVKDTRGFLKSLVGACFLYEGFDECGRKEGRRNKFLICRGLAALGSSDTSGFSVIRVVKTNSGHGEPLLLRRGLAVNA